MARRARPIAALENEGALVCERNANGLYAKTVCLPSGFFEQTRASLFEKDGTGGPDPTPTPTVARPLRERIRKRKRKRRLALPPGAWEHAGVVDAFAVPNRENEKDVVRVDRRRAFVSLETRPDGAGRRDASRRNRPLNSVSRRLPLLSVQSEAAGREARRRDFDRKRRLDDVLAPDPPRRLGGARRRRRASAWPTLGQNMDATLETSALVGRRRKRCGPRGPRRVAAAEGVDARVARRTFPRGGPLIDDADGGKHDFDVKTALAVPLREGRAPAARVVPCGSRNRFGSGDGGFKRRSKTSLLR